MSVPVSRLSKLKSPYGNWVTDANSKLGVFHVDNQHTFTQAAGYLKHILASQSQTVVYYRGQSKLHPTLTPSLYRRSTAQKTKALADERLRAYLLEVKKARKVLRYVNEYAWEPLLQHYGIRTRWLDLVDNIWVALWFACYEAKSTGKFGQYLHFEPRRGGATGSYAYVVMVASQGTTLVDAVCPGLFRGPMTETIDLRTAVPSGFVRPHAQHALLFRRHKGLDHEHIDYSEFVVGVIRVTLSDALSWLGRGDLVAIHSLFPPPTYDYGFRELLDGAPPGNETVGSIHYVGA